MLHTENYHKYEKRWMNVEHKQSNKMGETIFFYIKIVK